MIDDEMDLEDILGEGDKGGNCAGNNDGYGMAVRVLGDRGIEGARKETRQTRVDHLGFEIEEGGGVDVNRTTVDVDNVDNVSNDYRDNHWDSCGAKSRLQGGNEQIELFGDLDNEPIRVSVQHSGRDKDYNQISIEYPGGDTPRQVVEGESFGFEEGEEPTWVKGVILGPAGHGKSHTIRERIKANKRYGVLCATTGIAAINLSTEDNAVSTINSLLHYFNTEELEVKYVRQKLQDSLMRLSEKYNALIVDEMSMWDGRQLQILHRALTEINRYKTIGDRGGFGLIMVGDFLQLPPVNAPYVFEMEEWSHYEPHMERLTKNYRQTSEEFKSALQAARHGDGETTVARLMEIPGVKWLREPEVEYEGTTIYATNNEVDSHNNIRLDKLVREGQKRLCTNSFTWGKKSPDWKVIPYTLELAIGAYVMVLNNFKGGPNEELVAANGSKGWVKDWDEQGKYYTVELEEPRFGVKEISVGYITRKTHEKYKEREHGQIKTPLGKGEFRANKVWDNELPSTYTQYLKELTDSEKRGEREPFYDYEKEMMVVGEIRFVPLRLGWATTIHKSQGLTLSNCQVDFVGSSSAQWLWSNLSGLGYVALSRIRDPKNLVIVGRGREIADKIMVRRKCLKWS